MQDEIPARDRILYASASFGGNLLSRTSSLWVLFYYSPPKDSDLRTILPRVVVGLIFLLVGIEDAIDDPLIGYWSDRTRTRWGRRIPFVVVSTPFYALFFFLLFTPPGADKSYLANGLYFTAVVLIQRLMSTLSGGPLEALLPEIARSGPARVSIAVWQVFLGALGAAFALIGTGFIKDAFGFQVMAGIVAVVAVVSRYVAVWGAWRHARAYVEPVAIGIVESVRQTLRNDQFLIFLPSFVFFHLAVGMLLAALPFFADSVILGDRDKLPLQIFGWSFSLKEGGITSLLSGTAIMAVLVALPFVYRLAVRRGKAWVYSTAMLFAALSFPALSLMGLVPGIDALPQSMLFVAVTGVAITGVFAFPNVILADIIDYDAARTGLRREALYYGVQNTLEKWVGSLSGLTLATLFLFGETADDPLGIRLVGPAAGVAAALGYLSFRRYGLTDGARGIRGAYRFAVAVT